jgi:DNA-binding NarL/FixJ family response regulator
LDGALCIHNRPQVLKKQEGRINSMKQTLSANAGTALLRRPSQVSELGGNSMSPQEALSSRSFEPRTISANVSRTHVQRGSTAPRNRISVLVVTADNITSELLRSAFAHGRQGFTVETLTGSSQKIIGELESHKADVTLISEELQDGPDAGMKVLQKTRESRCTSAIMLLQNSKPERVISAFRDGARGVFYRSHSLKSLSKCIQAVHQGQIWVCNEDVEHLLNALTHIKPLHLNNSAGMPLLTPREEDVVRLVADGLKNREIAQRLKVKEHSIRNYIYRIFDKLGVSSRVELFLYAFSHRDSS